MTATGELSTGELPARDVAVRVLALVAVAAAVAAAIALAVRVDFGPAPEVGRFRDDAYHYFCWARSLAAGDGPVAGAGIATSGLHVLWGVVLGAAAVVAGPERLPLVAQVLGLVLHAATAVLLARLALLAALRTALWAAHDRGGARLAAAAVGLLYLGNPFLLTEAQNGQDTALACFGTAVLLRCADARGRSFLAASVFAVAARSDLCLLVAALAVWRREPALRRALWPALALSAYAAWNVALAGQPWQDSAWPIPWLYADQFERTAPDLADRLARLWWFGRPCLCGGRFALASPAAGAVLVWAVCAGWCRGARRALPAAVTLGALVAGASDLAVPALAALFVALLDDPGPAVRRNGARVLSFALALCVLHELVRHRAPPYYFAPIAAGGFWLIAQVPLHKTLPVLLVLGTVLGGNAWQLRSPAPVRPWQETMSMAGRFVDRFVPPDEPIGCFNSGIVGWLRAGPIVNLDGVVNQAAFEALRAGALGAYLDRCLVRWVLDHPVQFAVSDSWPHACGVHFGAGFDPAVDLTEVARFVVPGVDAGRPGTDSFRLYLRGRKVTDGTRAASTDAAGGSACQDLGPAEDGGRYLLWRGAAGERLVLRSDAEASAGRSDVVLADGVDGVVLVVKAPAGPPGVCRLHVSSAALPIMEYHRL